MRVYTYKPCSTCRKATQWLVDNGFEFDEMPIRETPPSTDELMQMLEVYNGEIRRLFNTSGVDYREMGMKDKLPHMSREEALKLLSSNGNLVKRPFLLTETFKAVGFKEADWKNGLMKSR